jgi:phage terminase small subunit
MTAKTRRSASAGKPVTKHRAAKAAPRPLTAKQEAFCLEYLIDLNASQAAIRAGYSERTSRCVGSELLQNPQIAEQIRLNMARRANRTEINADRVLKEVARIGFSDVRKLFNGQGSLKAVHELDDDTAAAVASIEVVEEFDGKGEERRLIGYVKKIKMWDKNSGIEKLMKHLGLFAKENEQTNPGGAMAEFLAALSARGSRLPIKADPAA